MTDRGHFDPRPFHADASATWPSAPLADIVNDDGETLTTDDPWYLDGDTWTVTGAGTFQGLTLRAGGRLIAHAP